MRHSSLTEKQNVTNLIGENGQRLFSSGKINMLFVTVSHLHQRAYTSLQTLLNRVIFEVFLSLPSARPAVAGWQDYLQTILSSLIVHSIDILVAGGCCGGLLSSIAYVLYAVHLLKLKITSTSFQFFSFNYKLY